MTKTFGAVLAIALAISAAVWWTRAPTVAPQVAAAGEGAALVDVILPELTGEALLGQRAFEGFCAECHGANAAGRNGKAPPLVHVIYEPGHHGDIAFERAALLGVQSHHWQFGNMPPVENITRGDIRAIIAYVRTLQRANGIN